jgi:putative glutamine amidotransferase
MTPLVGITANPPNAAGRFEVAREYVDAVRRAGAIPVLISPGEQHIDELLERLDGVVLSGGGDIDPARWGSGGHPAIEHIDDDRDELELRLAREVADEGIPTLAICRGAQVVNVALGGTLHPHLPDVVGDDVAHRRKPKWEHRHFVEAEAGSLVAAAMGADRVQPASWHHQAIDRPGNGLAVTAWAPDGVIEAIEMPSHPWLVGVQWHPEVTAADDEAQQGLFDALVEAITGEHEG